MCRINLWVYLACIFPLFGFAYSNFISYGALESDQGGPNRALLQLTKKCNVSFQDMDYTILTTQCKGPAYPKAHCCDALKEFACPYTNEINDMETNCAETMFSYINLYGKYPAGLFANACKEGKVGLTCTEDEIYQKNAATAPTSGRSLWLFLLMLTVTAAVLLGW
ncbi:GPI-anchored protein LORELEI [Linum grandiflorum]